MTNKTVVARIHASSEHSASVENSLKKLAQEVLDKEPGVLGYSLHQDNELPNLYMMIELYENEDAFQYHLNTDHLKVFQKETDGKLEELSWRELTPV
ncbi:putative quinol monooxygenase [Vibrio hannami]|uniref:putative quinol monooxygenase n=1 Tax=Vibrio hannami TaxID=2717094 RepID=UPI00240FAC2E|nr:putative quinol monooxygenase [Vibrio hannami]MDG3088561.1 putative quinol monooxygenase [Vibrio hannami]